MKFTSLFAMLMPLVSLATGTPTTVSFSGSLVASNNNGVVVSADAGSSCTVEYQDIQNLGVNCTVNFLFSDPAASFTYSTSLTGGVNLHLVNGNMEASLNFQSEVSNPFSASSPYQLPAVTIPFPQPVNTNTPVAICLSNITSYLTTNSVEKLIVSQILGSTGSNACVTINFFTVNSNSASLSVAVDVDLLDVNNVANPGEQLALTGVLTAAGVQNTAPFKYTLNVGAAVKDLAFSGSATGSNKLRVLAPLPSYLNDQGTFILGGQQQLQQPTTLSPTVVAGVAVGAAGVVAIAAGVIIFRRRTAPARI